MANDIDEVFRNKEAFGIVRTKMVASHVHQLDRLAREHGVDRDTIVARALEEFLQRRKGREFAGDN